MSTLYESGQALLRWIVTLACRTMSGRRRPESGSW